MSLYHFNLEKEMVFYTPEGKMAYRGIKLKESGFQSIHLYAFLFVKETTVPLLVIARPITL